MKNTNGKLHWTQTPEGRARMSEIGKRRTTPMPQPAKRKYRRASLKRQPVEAAPERIAAQEVPRSALPRHCDCCGNDLTYQYASSIARYNANNGTTY